MSVHNHWQALNLMVGFAIVFMVILAILVSLNLMPLYFLGWYFAISLATYLLYIHDKNAAKNNSWRVAESSLHKLALAGGWIGAAFAHKFLPHKSAKPKFRKNFYITVVGNIVALVIIYYIQQYSSY